MSSKSSDQPPTVSRVVASQLVCNMMDAVQQLHKLKMSSEFVSTCTLLIFLVMISRLDVPSETCDLTIHVFICSV